MKLKISLLFVIFAFVFPVTASANIIFVDTNFVENDCSSIGTWNTLTQTCTMNHDVVGRIVMIDTGTILDGNGHTLSSNEDTRYGTGVEIFRADRITVKNLHVSNFYYGITADATGGDPRGDLVTLRDNSITASERGIEISRFDRFVVVGNTITESDIAINILSSDRGRVADNVIACPSNTCMADINLSLVSSSNIVSNKITGGNIGFDLGNISDLSFAGNTVSETQTALSIVADATTLRNIFFGNFFSDSGTGVKIVHSGGGGPILSLAGKFFDFLVPSALALSDDDNIFFHNDFVRNTQDVSVDSADSFRFSKLAPDGGNYWDKNITCADTNTDGFCDTPYLADFGVFDELPLTHSISVITPPPPLTLANPAETEDDNNQDAKGVADKTTFTFSVTANGNPDTINLIAVSETGTTTLPLSLRTTLSEYTATSTFPKGHYAWHVEATSGGTTVQTPDRNFTTGYSNVAFLPGLEASRLYRAGTGGGTKLWLPGTSGDVKKLYLNPTTGESTDGTIYSPDVLKTAYGVNIYQSFLDRMNDMTTSGDIERFETFPYDWRKDQKDAATQLVSTRPNGEFYSMILRLEEMASTSPTGKATLVTHSNGGLVAKELVEILRRQGKANMVDRIIMVAAPQLGTPKAIFEMLHGAEPFVVGIPNREVTRELAENMKSAYTLLPSRQYFNHLRTPLIRPLVEFSATTLATQNFRNLYGDSISDYDNLRSFLRGENDARIAPEPSDVNTPNVLKENFLVNAEIHHAFEDSWTPPSGIEVVQVIGWGITTPRGVEYRGIPNPPCVGFTNCTPKDLIDPQPLTTIEGDGTVVYSSAAAMDGEKYFIDLGQHNAWWQFNINRDHKNILEVTPIQNLIATLIKNKSAGTLPQYITTTKPVVTDADQRLRIGVHSPVALNLYDSLGRHTGPTPNPDLTSDFETNEEQIPNSYYWQIGEGQYAGADGATTTTIELKGTNIGTFTLDIENIIGDITATTTVYEGIPVTASTTAMIQVSATTTTPLFLDIDGDGKTDASITAGGLTAEDLTSILKGLVKTLNLPVEKEKKLIKKIEKLEKELQKENKNERKEKRKTARAFEEILKTIKKYEKKGVFTHDEAAELISVVEQIKQTVVK